MSAKKRQIDSSKKKEKPLPVGKPISQTTERRMYAAFEFKGQMFSMYDVVFLNTIEDYEAAAKFTEQQYLQKLFIGVIDSIFIENESVKREVYVGVRWFYKKDEIKDEKELAKLPADFGEKFDEIVLSDHYDENNARVVEGNLEVKLVVDTPIDQIPEMAKDSRHFLCRFMFITGRNRIYPLASACVLDGDDPQRSIQVARAIVCKSMRASLGIKYHDRAMDVNYGISSGEDGDDEAAAVAAAADDDDDDNNNNNNDDDDGRQKAPAKKRKTPVVPAAPLRMPTFDETRKLIVSRGELVALSRHPEYFSAVVGCLVLLKEKDEKAPKAVTSMVEIASVPAMPTPYRAYAVAYKDYNGQQQTATDCTTGVELLHADGKVRRRSIVNVRDRALEKVDYGRWVSNLNRQSAYPATDEFIKSHVDAIMKARADLLSNVSFKHHLASGDGADKDEKEK